MKMYTQVKAPTYIDVRNTEEAIQTLSKHMSHNTHLTVRNFKALSRKTAMTNIVLGAAIGYFGWILVDYQKRLKKLEEDNKKLREQVEEEIYLNWMHEESQLKNQRYDEEKVSFE